MQRIDTGRYTAEIEGDFVVFIIGARANSFHLIETFKDLGGLRRGMPKMLST